MNRECENVSLYFYGELDPAHTAAFEKHLQSCAHCQKDLAFLRQMQQALVPAAAPQHAVQAALDARRRTGWWRRVLRPALATGLVVALGVFFFVSGPRMHRLADDRTDLMAFISVEADDEYNSFAADFEAFENEF